jgi:hypothetical protein
MALIKPSVKLLLGIARIWSSLPKSIFTKSTQSGLGCASGNGLTDNERIGWEVLPLLLGESGLMAEKRFGGR